MMPLEVIHEGAARMQQLDPHGWTLTIIAVAVVFSALIILFILYSFSGALFTGRFWKKGSKAPDAETAAAIAMALDDYTSGGDEVAAIAAALHLYMSDSVHDVEPGIITIRRDIPSNWGDKSLNLRKKPLAK